MRVGQWWELTGFVMLAVGVAWALTPWALVVAGGIVFFAGRAWNRSNAEDG